MVFANERHEQILKLLEEKKKMSVAELSGILGVSEVTVRKDLEALERQKSLTRTFGGALFLEPPKPASSCSIPPESLDDYGRKQAIGALAAALVGDEDFIFLGPGYTCLEVAKNLKSKNRLAITTMNVSACIELADTPEFNVMLAPGSFTKRNGTYYVTGSVLIDYFSDSYFDKIFLTMDGISLTRGFSVLDDIIGEIDLALIMSVNPGFGGQKFIQNTLKKVHQLRDLIELRNSNALIEVDGGVNEETGRQLKEVGADILVAGNYVFKADDPRGRIGILKQL